MRAAEEDSFLAGMGWLLVGVWRRRWKKCGRGVPGCGKRCKSRRGHRVCRGNLSGEDLRAYHRIQ
ncbi:MAG: hypothetical protein EA350_17095 [Gemmatimonadales bacterium]|nr:MAG: hypothetical protein EA350_17095 [Gemmatimonadales bacterium]